MTDLVFVYERRLMNADGSTSTVAEIVEEMTAAGTARRFIDAWLFGLERGAASLPEAQYESRR